MTEGHQMSTPERPIHYWHIHHERLMEAATEPIANRIASIRERKPASEVPTRLRLLRVVADQDRAAAYHAAITSARAAYDAAVTPAQAAYDAARASAWAALAALHREECPDCPWDGTTIFPRGKP